MSDYNQFLQRKTQFGGDSGFNPVWMPDFLFDFQQTLVERSLLKGRSAIFADCGLGKSPMQLAWAENVVRKTNKRVLIATPLAVSDQTIREGQKFGIEAARSKSGILPAAKIVVTNYESLHRFNPSDFAGMVCDESSILKSFDGVTRKLITEFMRRLPYRLLCTATAAPNDYPEIGTSSEALGELGYTDMMTRFFKTDTSIPARIGLRDGGPKARVRFKHHAQEPFWKWVCSWARACRKPSDLGFDDGKFILPPLIERVTVVKASKSLPGFLPGIEVPAIGRQEQLAELRNTLAERCEAAARKILENGRTAVAWCNLNPEGDLLEHLLPGSKQLKGSQSDDEKEEILSAFSRGQFKYLVSKAKITCFGLNWQHCAYTTMFPSYSFEQYYQMIRRFLRFGQIETVIAEMITTEGQRDVLLSLQRKARAADEMFSSLVKHMNESMRVARSEYQAPAWEVPAWL